MKDEKILLFRRLARCSWAAEALFHRMFACRGDYPLMANATAIHGLCIRLLGVDERNPISVRRVQTLLAELKRAGLITIDSSGIYEVYRFPHEGDAPTHKPATEFLEPITLARRGRMPRSSRHKPGGTNCNNP